jgi:hypothetical protein
VNTGRTILLVSVVHLLTLSKLSSELKNSYHFDCF